MTGDFNGDGNVDLPDYAGFEACMLSPDGSLGTGCDCFDLDGNGDVDLRDFAEFQTAFTGRLSGAFVFAFAFMSIPPLDGPATLPVADDAAGVNAMPGEGPLQALFSESIQPPRQVFHGRP